MTQCAYNDCSEEAWQDCPKGFCIYHSPDNGKNKTTAGQVWQEARKRAQDPKGCNFRGWHFPKDLREQWFEKVTFPAGADFSQATFQTSVSFLEATFQGFAVFGEVTFQDTADFKGTNFHWPAEFHRTNFQGEAAFDAATFHDIASYTGATFHDTLEFYNSTFKGYAYFRGTCFQGHTSFLITIFNEFADFGGAAFMREIDISEARFHNFTEFTEVTFLGDVVARRLFPWDGTLVTIDLPSYLHLRRPSFERRPFRRPEQGEALYRLAKECARRQGNYRMAGKYHLAERCAAEYGNHKRYGWKPWHWRFWQAGVGWLFARNVFGYGERIKGVVITAALVIFGFAGYFWSHAAIGPKLSAHELATHEPSFLECLYFSAVSFSTLGYGDLVPNETYRLVASGEALLGAALMALFVVALTRKYIR